MCWGVGGGKERYVESGEVWGGCGKVYGVSGEVCWHVGKGCGEGLISSSLSSYHEKAAEALCVGRIQTGLGVALVSKFFRLNFLLTSLSCCLPDSTKQR